MLNHLKRAVSSLLARPAELSLDLLVVLTLPNVLGDHSSYAVVVSIELKRDFDGLSVLLLNDFSFRFEDIIKVRISQVTILFGYPSVSN